MGFVVEQFVINELTQIVPPPLVQALNKAAVDGCQLPGVMGIIIRHVSRCRARDCGSIRAAIACGPLLAGIICVLNAYSMLDRYREAMLDLLRGHGRSGQE